MTATIQVIYVYEFNYYGVDTDGWESSFSQFGSDSQVFDGRYACGNRSGTMDTHFFCGVPVGQTITRAIGSWDARTTNGLGGWSLSATTTPTTRSSARCTAATARRSAPRRCRRSSSRSPARPTPASAAAAAARNYPKDGQLATEANIDYMGDYVRSPDGNLYLHNGLNRNDIFRISRDGKIYLFAGNGSKDRAMTGDGGPAKDAGLGIVSALAAAPDGSLLIASYSDDNYAQVIRRGQPGRLEDRDDRRQRDRPHRAAGRRQARAGGPHRPGQRHDGRARRHDLLGRALQPDQQLQGPAAQARAGRHRHHGRRRAATRPPRTARPPPRSRSAATRRASRSAPTARSTSRSASRRWSSGSPPTARPPASRARASPPSAARSATGGKASESYIDSLYSIAAASDGTVYFRSLGNDVSPSAAVILKVDDERHRCCRPPGRLLGTCGNGRPDGEAATSVCMQNHSMTIGVDGDGGVTFADGRYLIRKVAPPLPGFDAEGLALPSGDGLEVYEFDRNGRHLRTRDGLTGAVIKTFEYDAAKRLIGVVDAYGNRTRIERDGAGMATAIVAPGGQRTALTHQRRRLPRDASPNPAGAGSTASPTTARRPARELQEARAAARPASTTTPTGG